MYVEKVIEMYSEPLHPFLITSNFIYIYIDQWIYVASIILKYHLSTY